MSSLPFIDLKAQYAQLKTRIDARIQAVLDHGQYIMGPEVKELEVKLAAYVGVKHCITVSSGTEALLIALMALDPKNVKWRQELVSGRHNLAVLDLQRSQLAAAKTGFLAERETLQELAVAEPANTSFLFQLTDVDSYLGSIAERAGDFAGASARFAEQTRGLEALVARDPKTAHWTFKLADSLSWEAGVMTITGRLDEASTRYTRVLELLTGLTALDPENRRWLLPLHYNRFRQARVEAARGSADRAAQILAEVRPRFEQLVAGEPEDAALTVRLMNLLRFEAELGRDGAAAAGLRAVTLGGILETAGRLDDLAAGDFALALITAGNRAAAGTQADSARALWTRAFELLRPRIDQSRDWHLLDPAARALANLGRLDESRHLVEQLHASGYVPPDPWPLAVSFR